MFSCALSLTRATSAPGLGSPPAHICTGTGLTPATSALRTSLTSSLLLLRARIVLHLPQYRTRLARASHAGFLLGIPLQAPGPATAATAGPDTEHSAASAFRTRASLAPAVAQLAPGEAAVFPSAPPTEQGLVRPSGLLVRIWPGSIFASYKLCIHYLHIHYTCSRDFLLVLPASQRSRCCGDQSMLAAAKRCARVHASHVPRSTKHGREPTTPITRPSAAGLGSPLATSAPGLGSFFPHLHRDSARPAHICTGTGLIPTRSSSGLGSPMPHLRRDWAHPDHICAGTGLTLAHICAGTGLTPMPHLRRDWAHPDHICAGTGLTLPTSAPGLGCGAGTGGEPRPGADVGRGEPSSVPAPPDLPWVQRVLAWHSGGVSARDPEGSRSCCQVLVIVIACLIVMAVLSALDCPERP